MLARLRRLNNFGQLVWGGNLNLQLITPPPLSCPIRAERFLVPNPIREDLGYRAQPQTWLSRTGLSLLGKIFCWNPGNPNGGANPIGEDFLLQSGKPWVVLILLGGVY